MAELAGAFVVLVGFCSGVLSALFGVGGAVVATPGLRLAGASALEAVGSTVPMILPASLTGTIRYHRAGLVDWRVSLVCGVSGSAFAVAGGWLSGHVNGHALMLLTAGLLAYTALRTARGGQVRKNGPVPAGFPSGRSAPAHIPEIANPVGRAEPASATLAAVGAVSGFVAGLLGVGGGIVMMPMFTQVLALPLKRAVASSLVAVGIFSVPAMLTHTVLGHINWTYALLLVAGVVPGSFLGTRITLSATERTLRILVGAFLGFVAAGYGLAEAAALVGAD
jgi:uncharacterized membrane protein YfcA